MRRIRSCRVRFKLPKLPTAQAHPGIRAHLGIWAPPGAMAWIAFPSGSYWHLAIQAAQRRALAQCHPASPPPVRASGLSGHPGSSDEEPPQADQKLTSRHPGHPGHPGFSQIGGCLGHIQAPGGGMAILPSGCNMLHQGQGIQGTGPSRWPSRPDTSGQ